MLPTTGEFAHGIQVAYSVIKSTVSVLVQNVLHHVAPQHSITYVFFHGRHVPQLQKHFRPQLDGSHRGHTNVECISIYLIYLPTHLPTYLPISLWAAPALEHPMTGVKNASAQIIGGL